MPSLLEAAQLGALLSPGRLARAHQALEGSKCQQCHEAGRKVTAARCLTCHKPVAERIASKRGVHRAVTECVSCHVEHAGIEGDLRHLDTRTFNHRLETGYALDGRHAAVTGTCASCHKGRSFLEAKTACASCHTDVHKGSLGTDCARCHSTSVAFKSAGAQFNHALTRFPLVGAHSTVSCAQCHRNGAYAGIPFGSCTACHTDPHAKRFGESCTQCHTTERWNTQTVQHAKTRFPLSGAHVRVACTKCHSGKTMTEPLRSARCVDCHVNIHKDSIKDDCGSCHSDSSFKGGRFDHTVQTRFPLLGKHEALSCAKCHQGVSTGDVPLAKRTADFGGARAECVSCHANNDPHKGQFGRACDSCHTAATFSVKEFRHPREPAFFSGGHGPVTCEKCHVANHEPRPAAARAPSMSCVSCHADVHLGQFEQTCERCHRVDGARFSALAFSHERTALPLTGKHGKVACAACHPTETRAFPAHAGTAVVFTPLKVACAACHSDPHLGQVDTRCETCHTTETFTVGAGFVHKGLEDFFAGIHGRYACVDCHKKERARYPAGEGVAVRLIVGRTCAACHPQF